jgi:hypothetical protein
LKLLATGYYPPALESHGGQQPRLETKLMIAVQGFETLSARGGKSQLTKLVWEVKRLAEGYSSPRSEDWPASKPDCELSKSEIALLLTEVKSSATSNLINHRSGF